MQGSFEKKVQEKLDELKLTPSAPVWEKISLEITPQKRRRRAFFWLPLGVLLMVGAGWWLWTSGEKEEVALSGKGVETATTAKSEKNTSSEKTTKQIPSGKGSSKATAFPQQEEPPAHETATLARKTKTIIGDGNPSQNQTKAPVTAKASKSSPSSVTGTPLSLYKKEMPVLTAKSRKVTGEASEKNTTETDSETILANKAPNIAINKSVTTEEKEPAVTAAAPVINTDSLAAEKKPETLLKDSAAVKRKIAAHRKWRLAITAQAGWSGPATNQPAVYLDAYSSPSPNAGGVQAGPVSPNAISGGRAYSISVGLSRSISSRLQVSAALQYATYQSKTKVGAYRPLDTSLFFRSQSVSVGGYYRNGQQQDYTIRHQVLELPVSISYQPLRSLPLLLTAGASYGRLLKSNALTFNRNGNFYFENKENLSRHQVGLFSAVQYQIIRKSSFALSAGPAVQYQLTSFQKEAGTGKPKLLFAGLKTSINF